MNRRNQLHPPPPTGHATAGDSAPRCEIAFFASLGISAKVSPLPFVPKMLSPRVVTTVEAAFAYQQPTPPSTIVPRWARKQGPSLGNRSSTWSTELPTERHTAAQDPASSTSASVSHRSPGVLELALSSPPSCKALVLSQACDTAGLHCVVSTASWALEKGSCHRRGSPRSPAQPRRRRCIGPLTEGRRQLISSVSLQTGGTNQLGLGPKRSPSCPGPEVRNGQRNSNQLMLTGEDSSPSPQPHSQPAACSSRPSRACQGTT